MPKFNKRKVLRVKEDIISGLPPKDLISELPEHIREAILGFLPLQDAVRTSLLSRKWRHCWTMIPHLIFEDEFVDRILGKLMWYDDPELKALKLVSVINNILLLHKGPILKFSFSFSQHDCDYQIIHQYIDQWVPLFSENGIRQLALEDLELRDSPSHDFSSLHLTHLKLINLWFPYPPTIGVFPYLTNLELIHVEPTNLTATEQRIFDCPVLEKLTLILCDGILPSNFSAPKLKCLQHLCREITSEYSISGLENLTEYSFGLLEESSTQTSNVNKVLGSLPKIEKFYIAIKFMQYLAAGHAPQTLSKPLPCLKTLHISDVRLNKLSDVSCLLCLIRSAPNLCKLNISADYFVEGDLNNDQIEDSVDYTLDHLEIVTFSNFKGFSVELELVRILLARSPVLKKMFIHYGGGSEKFVAFKMLKKTLQYPRASSRVQIRRAKHSVDMDDFDAYCLYFS